MKIENIKIEKIYPNLNQPRKIFKKESLDELVESIELKGVIQPIILKKEYDKYIIIAGERRWRASKEAGLKTIPSIVKEVDSIEEMELSIIENVQREDLTPIEEALIYKKYLDETGNTQVYLGKTLGKSRSYISNIIRLLKLPEDIIALINKGKLSYGHGKILLSIKNKEDLQEISIKVVKEKLSVRELELLVRNLKRVSEKDVFIKNIEYELENSLGNKVNINESTKGGKIVINYENSDDLEDIVERLLK